MALNSCMETYFSQPRLENIFPGGQGTYKQITNIETDQVVTIFKGTITENEVARPIHILAYRGTDGLTTDWLTNMSMVKKEVPLPEGFDCSGIDKGWFNNPPRIHSGFWGAWQSLKPDVERYFEEENAKGGLRGSRILLCGHSMGGLVSVCCAYELYHYQKKYGVDISVINCGAPRGLDWYSCQIMNAMYPDGIRVCNGFDIVTFAVCINAYHCFKPLSLWPETYWQCVKQCAFIPSVGAHLMTNYLKKIDRIGNDVLDKFKP